MPWLYPLEEGFGETWFPVVRPTRASAFLPTQFIEVPQENSLSVNSEAGLRTGFLTHEAHSLINSRKI